jgi:FAD:protein FMN transferase
MQKFIYRFDAMSTPCELILYAKDKTLADSAAEAVLLETKRLEKKYNYFKDDSYISAINKRHTNILDKETKTILQNAKAYYKETEGTFDITIATIKDLYKNETKTADLESKKEALMEFVGCEHFNIKKEKILFDNEFTKIDLGGFVKEYAVDRAVGVLKKKKITSALVNFGGDIYALGKKPDNTKFKVGIKNPDDKTKYITEVEIENEALTTSASYERNYTIEEKVYSHIITKEDTPSKAKSVTVISNNCVQSGIYSTSLMINDTLQTKLRTIVI